MIEQMLDVLKLAKCEILLRDNSFEFSDPKLWRLSYQELRQTRYFIALLPRP